MRCWCCPVVALIVVVVVVGRLLSLLVGRSLSFLCGCSAHFRPINLLIGVAGTADVGGAFKVHSTLGKAGDGFGYMLQWFATKQIICIACMSIGTACLRALLISILGKAAVLCQSL